MYRQLLTENEVAAILALSPKTLRNWRCTGVYPGGVELPFVKLGRAVRYEKADLDIFIDSLPKVANTGEADKGLEFLLVESMKLGKEN